MPYSRRRDGKLVLRLAAAIANASHLADDNKCGIYEIRPEMCRDFPDGERVLLVGALRRIGYL